MTNPIIKTLSGIYSKEKFNALIDVRQTSLSIIRKELEDEKFTEVLTAVLVNIAGSCENPYTSFKLPYYGKEAHLSQSAQIQLEKIVVGLNRKCFTVNNSFREENYEDPESNGRRLSEFTLIEPEMPFHSRNAEENMLSLMQIVEKIIKATIKINLEKNIEDLRNLGADIYFLENTYLTPFKTIRYSEALELLNKISGKRYVFGNAISLFEEKLLLKQNNNIPFFLTEFPFEQKFFNIKKTYNGDTTYSFDLIAPLLGETVGGGVREESPTIVLDQLKASSVGQYLFKRNEDPEIVFQEYFNALFQNEPIYRGGFGVGFERLIGFLINSNDILNTITHRSFLPINGNKFKTY